MSPEEIVEILVQIINRITVIENEQQRTRQMMEYFFSLVHVQPSQTATDASVLATSQFDISENAPGQPGQQCIACGMFSKSRNIQRHFKKHSRNFQGRRWLITRTPYDVLPLKYRPSKKDLMSWAYVNWSWIGSKKRNGSERKEEIIQLEQNIEESAHSEIEENQENEENHNSETDSDHEDPHKEDDEQDKDETETEKGEAEETDTEQVETRKAEPDQIIEQDFLADVEMMDWD